MTFPVAFYDDTQSQVVIDIEQEYGDHSSGEPYRDASLSMGRGVLHEAIILR